MSELSIYNVEVTVASHPQGMLCNSAVIKYIKVSKTERSYNWPITDDA